MFCGNLLRNVTYNRVLHSPPICHLLIAELIFLNIIDFLRMEIFVQKPFFYLRVHILLCTDLQIAQRGMKQLIFCISCADDIRSNCGCFDQAKCSLTTIYLICSTLQIQKVLNRMPFLTRRTAAETIATSDQEKCQQFSHGVLAVSRSVCHSLL